MITAFTCVAAWWLIGALPGAAWSYHVARVQGVPRRHAALTALPMGAVYGVAGPFIPAAMVLLWVLFKVLAAVRDRSASP